MGFYSAWPVAIILFGLFALAATPLFKAADKPPSPTPNRVSTLDGLRGFLALAVFFHHGAIYHTYIQGLPWSSPPDRLYGLLGPFGVAIFFMITGFLFWGKVLAKDGRPDRLSLYVGRLFRIAPIYWLAVSLVLITTFFITGPRLTVSPGALMMQIARWLAVGLLQGKPVNGFAQTGNLIANVTWSLRYEWLFYISLLVTSLFARNRVTAWLFPASALVASLGFEGLREIEGKPGGDAILIALFSIGMVTACARRVVQKFDFDRLALSAVTAALIAGFLAVFDTAYAVVPTIVLGAIFFLIANGTSLFGVLTSRPARRLGDISFGIYLLQGLVLAAVFATSPSRAFALSSPLNHWLLVAAAGILLIGVSTAVHAMIERPGINAGHRLVGRLRGGHSGP